MAPTLSRRALSRLAFDRAYEALNADAEAGRISWADASAKFARLWAAYDVRRNALSLQSFIASHGLSHVFTGVRP